MLKPNPVVLDSQHAAETPTNLIGRSLKLEHVEAAKQCFVASCGLTGGIFLFSCPCCPMTWQVLHPELEKS